LEVVPEDVRARLLLARDLAAAGEADEAVRHLEIAVALRPDDGNTLYNAACAYGILQRKEAALEMLRKAIGAGYSNVDWWANDPDLACLHDDPEFHKLIGRTSQAAG